MTIVKQQTNKREITSNGKDGQQYGDEYTLLMFLLVLLSEGQLSRYRTLEHSTFAHQFGFEHAAVS